MNETNAWYRHSARPAPRGNIGRNLWQSTDDIFHRPTRLLRNDLRDAVPDQSYRPFGGGIDPQQSVKLGVPRHITGGPLGADAAAPQSQLKILYGTTTGGVVLFREQRILRSQARDCQPAGDGGPLPALGSRRLRALLLGDEFTVEINDPTLRFRTNQMKSPGLRSAMIGRPAGKFEGLLHNCGIDEIRAKRPDGATRAKILADDVGGMHGGRRLQEWGFAEYVSGPK